MNPPSQLRLPLPRTAELARTRFAASAVNQTALDALARWPTWPGGALALVGPEGSGKSHMAALWRERANALVWRPALTFEAMAGRAVLVEDADAIPGETLFHLINLAPTGGGLLLTARIRPVDWPATLPDLRSRLNALTVAELGEPDDTVLAAMLENLFASLGIRPSPDVYPYLLRRMDRSAAAARAMVEALDEAAAAQRREVNRALARELFEEVGSLDLFDDEPTGV